MILDIRPGLVKHVTTLLPPKLHVALSLGELVDLRTDTSGKESSQNPMEVQ